MKRTNILRRSYFVRDKKSQGFRIWCGKNSENCPLTAVRMINKKRSQKKSKSWENPWSNGSLHAINQNSERIFFYEAIELERDYQKNV